MLAQLRGLEYLDLSMNDFDKSQTIELLTVLMNSKTVKTLIKFNLYRSLKLKDNDDGVVALAEFLANAKRIQYINISRKDKEHDDF